MRGGREMPRSGAGGGGQGPWPDPVTRERCCFHNGGAHQEEEKCRSRALSGVGGKREMPFPR